MVRLVVTSRHWRGPGAVARQYWDGTGSRSYSTWSSFLIKDPFLGAMVTFLIWALFRSEVTSRLFDVKKEVKVSIDFENPKDIRP